MSRFIVQPVDELRGNVVVGGCKNTTLKSLISFPLVAAGEMVLENPATNTQATFLQHTLVDLGASCKLESSNELAIKADSLSAEPKKIEASTAQCRHITRMAVPMVTHLETFNLARPGYSPYGARPIEPLLSLLKDFDIEVDSAGPFVKLNWSSADRLNGIARLITDSAGRSVACRIMSESALMAAVARKGKTTIVGIAQEPDILDLVKLFQSFAPVSIKGVGTTTWEIESEGLDISKFYETKTLIPGDYLEAATIAAAVAATGGEVTIGGFDPARMLTIIGVLRRTGCGVEILDDGIKVFSERNLVATSFGTDDFPGFPTDAQGPFLTLLSLCRGRSMVKEKIWTNRLTQAAELNKMGAEVSLIDSQTAIIHGVSELYATEVVGTCPRSTAGLVIAGLVANGETHVHGADLVDNAYTSLIENLNALGAQIYRDTSATNFSPRSHPTMGRLEAF